MKKYISFFLLGGLLLINHSCYYDQELVFEVPDIPDDVAISFSSDIEPMFAKCTGCHNGSVFNPDLRAGNAYDDIIGTIIPGNAEASEFYQKLPGNGNNHPGGNDVTLSATEVATIKAWIDRGAENN